MESKHGLRYVRLEFKEESQNLFLRYDCKETNIFKIRLQRDKVYQDNI